MWTDDVDKQLRGLSSKLQKLITSMNVSLVSMLVSVNKKLDYVHKFMEEVGRPHCLAGSPAETSHANGFAHCKPHHIHLQQNPENRVGELA